MDDDEYGEGSGLEMVHISDILDLLGEKYNFLQKITLIFYTGTETFSNKQQKHSAGQLDNDETTTERANQDQLKFTLGITACVLVLMILLTLMILLCVLFRYGIKKKDQNAIYIVLGKR